MAEVLELLVFATCPYLNQMNAVHALPYCVLKICFNAIISSTPRSNRDTVVGIATRLRAGRSRLCIPTAARDLSPKRPDRPWSSPSFLFSGYRVSFPGVKRSEREVDHLPPSSADFQNVCSYDWTGIALSSQLSSTSLPKSPLNLHPLY